MNITFSAFERINALRDPSRLGEGELPLLVNGRTRRGLVSPVPAHSRITAPQGNYQFVGCAGQYLLLVVDGVLFIKDMDADTPFSSQTSWTPMDATSDFIYGCLVPMGSSVVGFSDGNPSAMTTKVLPIPSQSPHLIMLADGIHQPLLVVINGIARNARTYATWTQALPEYVPPMICPVVSGTKLYGIAPDRRSIYHSVSGRPLDFVINRNSAGDAGGDATTTSKSVDYHPLTGIIPVTEGGLLACTLYSTYLISLDTSRMLWGEPFLADSLVFNCGMTNHLSFADINGDIGLITQTGVQSVTTLVQQKKDSRIDTLSSAISALQYGTQEDTCAVTFQNYALFSMNSMFGPMVFVYDLFLRAWVSLDQFPGQVKKFSVMRLGGIERLFFITWDNALYEAYAGPGTAVLRMLTPNFRGQSEQLTAHRATHCKVALANVLTGGKIKLTYIGDTKPHQEGVGDVAATEPTPSFPYPFGTNPYTDTPSFELALSGTPKVRTSAILLESTVGGDIAEIGLEYVRDEKLHTGLAKDPDKIVIGVFNGFAWNTPPPTAALQIATSCIVGNDYLIYGSCTDGEFTYVNQQFCARKTMVAVDAGSTLYELGRGSLAAIKEMLLTCDEVIGVDDLYKGPLTPMFLPDGLKTSIGFWLVNFWTATTICNYFHQKYYELTDKGVFILEGGRKSSTSFPYTFTQISPCDTNSEEFQFFTKNPGWMAVSADSPYGVFPNVGLRWPFADYGCRLIVTAAYDWQRTRVGNVEYVGTPSIQGTGHDGHWTRVTYTPGFSILVEQVTPSGVQDTFTIHI